MAIATASHNKPDAQSESGCEFHPMLLSLLPHDSCRDEVVCFVTQSASQCQAAALFNRHKFVEIHDQMSHAGQSGQVNC